MANNDNLGDRMKEYEDTTRHHLIRRMPVIHTFTKCLKHFDMSMETTPFSIKMHHVMTATALGLMSQIQNSVFCYTQSDEISILLRDWDKHETEQWFNGAIQKVVSVSASTASVIFNHFFAEEVRKPESQRPRTIRFSRIQSSRKRSCELLHLASTGCVSQFCSDAWTLPLFTEADARKEQLTGTRYVDA